MLFTSITLAVCSFLDDARSLLGDLWGFLVDFIGGFAAIVLKIPCTDRLALVVALGVLLLTIYNILYSKDKELPLVCLLGSIATIIVVIYLNQDTFVTLGEYIGIYTIIVKQYL